MDILKIFWNIRKKILWGLFGEHINYIVGLSFDHKNWFATMYVASSKQDHIYIFFFQLKKKKSVLESISIRSFLSRESKFLAYTISKHYFLAFNTSLYNTSYMKDSIFCTTSFKYYYFYSLYVSFSLLSLSSYLCLSLSLKAPHFLCKPTM